MLKSKRATIFKLTKGLKNTFSWSRYSLSLFRVKKF